MSDNFSILWVQENLNKAAMTRAAQAIQETGRALPCQVTAVSGSFVTVNFQVTFPSVSAELTNKQSNTLPPITIPKAESQWLRAPTQIGDYGLTVPADTFLGGISGQGTGTADLSINYGNLATLAWVPIGAMSFTASPDADKAWVNGPNGAVLSDADQTVVVTADKTTGQVSIAVGGTVLLIVDKSSGTVQIAGSGTGGSDGLIRVSDLQTALDDFKAAMVTADVTNASAITVPTVTGSDKAFSA